MSYIRFFFPMTSEANGYGLKGRQPVGRSIVEERSHNCKLTVWAQDLKSETLYNIFMLFKDGENYAGVKMGPLTVDEKGKAEVRREFEYEELGPFKLAEIVAVVIIAKDVAGVVSPLSGYKDGVVSWRSKFYEYARTIVAIQYEDAPLVPPADDATHVMQAVEDIAPIMGDSIAHEPDIELLPEHNHAHIDESPPVAGENHIAEPDLAPDSTDTVNDIIPIDSHDENEANTYDPTPIRQFMQSPPPQSEIAKSFRVALDQLHADTVSRSTPHHSPQSIESLFATKERVFPFQRQTRKTDWIRFDLSDQVPPPTNKPRLYQEPFILAALAEYGHLILGMTVAPGAKHYIIGVPNNADPESRSNARRLGFTQFKHCEDAQPGDALGYWLMFITA